MGAGGLYGGITETQGWTGLQKPLDPPASSHPLPPSAMCLELGHRSQIEDTILDKALTPDAGGRSRVPRAPLLRLADYKFRSSYGHPQVDNLIGRLT